jgi:hypothetical protein
MTWWALLTIAIFGLLLRRQHRRRRAASFRMGEAWMNAHRRVGGDE